MTCPHCRSAGEFFGDKTARSDLKRYRKKGLRRQTRWLVDALVEEGVEGATLLDIGGGVGQIQHELLDRGLDRAVHADASASYQEAARREAERRGHGDRIDFYLGDFVEMAGGLPPADVVTLDRVVCCYPDMPALVDRSAERARRLYGLVLPRDVLLLRIFFPAANLVQRLRRDAFRIYLHPPDDVETRLADRGFERTFHRKGFLWETRVYRRRAGSAGNGAPPHDAGPGAQGGAEAAGHQDAAGGS